MNPERKSCGFKNIRIRVDGALGPLLFLIYINDIQVCSEKLKFFLFADDTNILYADKILGHWS